MSRVFFEAYVAATKELAAQEDRFPSLSEIDAKMESGAVYAFKDRLMKNTEFFEEVKISGVSYLVPRALKFMDVTGTYTDLILSFDEGTVILPTRRKTPLNLDGSGEEHDAMAPEVTDESHKDIFVQSPQTANGVQEQSPAPENTDATPPGDVYINASPPSVDIGPSPSQNEPDTSVLLHTAEPFAEIAEPDQDERTSSFSEPVHNRPQESTSMIFQAKAAASVHLPTAKDAGTSVSTRKILGLQPKVLIGLGLVAILVVAIAIGLLFDRSAPIAKQPAFIEYSAYISNASNESFLALDILNSQNMANDMEMILPPDIDRSISARGGIITISHGENTVVRMNSSSDASVKIYLNGNWSSVPLGLTFATLPDYDTSLLVHDEDYLVTRKNDTLVLKLNLTGEEVKFEQSYTRKE